MSFINKQPFTQIIKTKIAFMLKSLNVLSDKNKTHFDNRGFAQQ